MATGSVEQSAAVQTLENFVSAANEFTISNANAYHNGAVVTLYFNINGNFTNDTIIANLQSFCKPRVSAMLLNAANNVSGKPIQGAVWCFRDNAYIRYYGDNFTGTIAISATYLRL